MTDNQFVSFFDTPLLLKSARRLTTASQDYRYDSTQALNISDRDDTPVVGSAQGRSMLKTMAEVTRGED